VLKIAVVTRNFPSSAEPWQGRSVYQTLRVLAREADVRVFYPNASYPSWLRPRSRIYDKLDTSYSPPDMKVNYYDFLALPLISRPMNGWSVARVLRPPISNFAPDIIFSFFLYPEGYAALKIGKPLGVPVVARSMGSDINRIGDPISALHTRTVLREADFLVTVSDDLRRKAMAMGATQERIRTIVNGCDQSIFHVRDRLPARQVLQIDSASEVVVYVGRMDLRKGLRELIEAATAIHPQRPDLHVYLVGEGPDRKHIQSLIDAKNADEYVHVPPGCRFDEVAVWMAAADVVTLPSYMEGCPNVILEALACGRPVVATNVGGIPEIMSDECGLLVPPRDSMALAEGLTSVLDRTWNSVAISSQWGRSWNDVAVELRDIFKSLVSARQATMHIR
jgi:teichuronic acid biosynthesis glycosyltransferase TuaC